MSHAGNRQDQRTSAETVPTANSKASASRGATQPSSRLIRIRALAITRTELFPARIRFWSSSCCSGASRTAYLPRTITATPAISTSSRAVYDYRLDSLMTFNFKVDQLLVITVQYSPSETSATNLPGISRRNIFRRFVKAREETLPGNLQ